MSEPRMRAKIGPHPTAAGPDDAATMREEKADVRFPATVCRVQIQRFHQLCRSRQRNLRPLADRFRDRPQPPARSRPLAAPAPTGAPARAARVPAQRHRPRRPRKGTARPHRGVLRDGDRRRRGLRRFAVVPRRTRLLQGTLRRRRHRQAAVRRRARRARHAPGRRAAAVAGEPAPRPVLAAVLQQRHRQAVGARAALRRQRRPAPIS